MLTAHKTTPEQRPSLMPSKLRRQDFGWQAASFTKRVYVSACNLFEVDDQELTVKPRKVEIETLKARVSEFLKVNPQALEQKHPNYEAAKTACDALSKSWGQYYEATRPKRVMGGKYE